jgi:hypothetical protein
MAVFAAPARCWGDLEAAPPVAAASRASTAATRASGGASRLQAGAKPRQRLRRALGLDLHPLAVVAHPAGQPVQFLRQPVDEGPEAHALHRPRTRMRWAPAADRHGPPLAQLPRRPRHVRRLRAQRTPCSSQASHSSMPSPLVADTCSTCDLRVHAPGVGQAGATSNCR